MRFPVFLAPVVAGSAVVLLLAVSFFVDGLRWLIELRHLWRRRQATLPPCVDRPSPHVSRLDAAALARTRFEL
jgi:hypothetical protein